MNTDKLYKENSSQDIEDLINADIWRITCEQGGIFKIYGAAIGETDGMHSGTGIIERVVTDIIPGYENFTLRVYVLSTNCGGVCIIGTKDNMYTILQLSEDDGHFFIHTNHGFMTKSDFLDMTCRAISLLNNRKNGE